MAATTPTPAASAALAGSVRSVAALGSAQAGIPLIAGPGTVHLHLAGHGGQQEFAGLAALGQTSSVQPGPGGGSGPPAVPAAGVPAADAAQHQPGPAGGHHLPATGQAPPGQPGTSRTAPAHVTAASGTPASHARATSPSHGPAPARPAATHAPARPARLAHPYRIYDSVTPGSIPGRQAAAVYATGSYAASPGQLHRLGHVIWIDTTGTDYQASVLDVEPGDATPAQAASWAFHRLIGYPHAVVRIYTMRALWPAAQSAIQGLPKWMQAHVHWWIADPTGVPHIVPGSQATQWYWGPSYDITSAMPGF